MVTVIHKNKNHLKNPLNKVILHNENVFFSFFSLNFTMISQYTSINSLLFDCQFLWKCINIEKKNLILEKERLKYQRILPSVTCHWSW